MKKIITISTLFASSVMLFAASPACPDSPITTMVSLSQKGGADSALSIMQIQAKENLDISKDQFLISLLAYCSDSEATLIEAAKSGNDYAIKALKMLRTLAAQDALLELSKSEDSKLRKSAMDALSTCGSAESLSFFIDNMSTTASSNLGDYVKVSTELYRALDDDDKAKFKADIEARIASADGKIKIAFERIIIEEKPVEAEGKKGKGKKKKG